MIDGVVFEPGNWTPDLKPGTKGSSWGNHRAVVVLDPAGRARPDLRRPSLVTIPWRRHDPNPAAKAIVVVDARTNEPIANALATRVDQRVRATWCSAPNPGSNTYYVYYMPWQTSGGPYPTVTYPSSVLEPDAAWAAASAAWPLESLPRGRTTRIQSVDAFHSFFPMEIIATDAERARFAAPANGGWRAVAEYRDYPIRMRRLRSEALGRRVAVRDAREPRVLRDEYFTFQVGVVAGNAPLDDVRVAFEGFPETWRRTLTCFNTGGVDETRPGVHEEGRRSRPARCSRCGSACSSRRTRRLVWSRADVVVSAAGTSQPIRLKLDVGRRVAVNHGFDEPEMMTRLAWLNSTAGTDPGLHHPAVRARGDRRRRRATSCRCWGAPIVLGASGLPERILSYFTPEVTLGKEPHPVLARPLGLEIVIGGAAERLRPGGFTVRREAKSRASWSVESRSDRLRMTVAGALEYDGMLDYRIEVEALKDVDVDDVVLPVSLVPGAAEYMLGLGRKGGRRPERDRLEVEGREPPGRRLARWGQPRPAVRSA